MLAPRTAERPESSKSADVLLGSDYILQSHLEVDVAKHMRLSSSSSPPSMKS